MDACRAVGEDGECIYIGVFVVRGGELDVRASPFSLLHFVGADGCAEVKRFPSVIRHAVGLTHIGQVREDGVVADGKRIRGGQGTASAAHGVHVVHVDAEAAFVEGFLYGLFGAGLFSLPVALRLCGAGCGQRAGQHKGVDGLSHRVAPFLFRLGIDVNITFFCRRCFPSVPFFFLFRNN